MATFCFFCAMIIIDMILSHTLSDIIHRMCMFVSVICVSVCNCMITRQQIELQPPDFSHSLAIPAVTMPLWSDRPDDFQAPTNSVTALATGNK